MFFIQNKIWPVFKGDKKNFTDFCGLMAVCKKQKVFLKNVQSKNACIGMGKWSNFVLYDKHLFYLKYALEPPKHVSKWK